MTFSFVCHAGHETIEIVHRDGERPASVACETCGAQASYQFVPISTIDARFHGELTEAQVDRIKRELRSGAHRKNREQEERIQRKEEATRASVEKHWADNQWRLDNLHRPVEASTGAKNDTPGSNQRAHQASS